MKQFILSGALVVAACAVVIGGAQTESKAWEGVWPRVDHSHHNECTLLGCSGEEIEEIYEIYDEECNHEGCNIEEKFELVYTNSWRDLTLDGRLYRVNTMETHFENLGWKTKRF